MTDMEDLHLVLAGAPLEALSMIERKGWERNASQDRHVNSVALIRE